MNSKFVIKNYMNRWVFHLLALLAIYSASFSSNASKWPMITDIRITECKDYPGAQGQFIGYTCNYYVYYAVGGVTMVDIPDDAPPSVVKTTVVNLWGMHCAYGDAASGVPYSGCFWVNGEGHSPSTKNCRTTTTDGWILTPTSTCIPTYPNYGPHSASGAGGECLMYGKYAYDILYTPYGPMDANVVANSMHHLCIKPVPPSVTCELIPLDGLEFDHGIMTASSVDTRSLAFNIDCGVNPSVITGSGQLRLADGVTSELTAKILSDSNMIVISKLTTSAAAQPGAYSGSDIIIISPQ